MSVSHLLEDVGVSADESAISSETVSESSDAMIARAKEIIAGRLQPPPFVAPKLLLDHFEREFRDKNPPPMREALDAIIDRHCIDTIYSGKLVAYTTMKSGRLTVLATGLDDIEKLFKALVGKERLEVVVTDTETY
jgi:hypothetical protein